MVSIINRYYLVMNTSAAEAPVLVPLRRLSQSLDRSSAVWVCTMYNKHTIVTLIQKLHSTSATLLIFRPYHSTAVWVLLLCIMCNWYISQWNYFHCCLVLTVHLIQVHSTWASLNLCIRSNAICFQLCNKYSTIHLGRCSALNCYLFTTFLPTVQLIQYTKALSIYALCW